MNFAATCSHCQLPVGVLGQRREVGGEDHVFCCYGCCLAFQVHHGEPDEPAAAALLIRLGIGAFLAMNIMLFSLLRYSGGLGGEDAWLAPFVDALLWLLATPAVAILGRPFVTGAWSAGRAGRVNADALVAVGALGAYGYSSWQVLRGSGLVYFDTATMVLLVFTLGRYLEAQARVRAARSFAPMLAAERAIVHVVADGRERACPAAQVQVGDSVRIRPHERLGVDGIVLHGHSDCVETILTGQAEPRPKAPGAIVHAGSVNGQGTLLVRATVAGTDTQWARMGRRVREALATRSALGELLDRVAAVFVPFVLLLALAVFWFWGARTSLELALLAALSVLVVACPCSLGLAAPIAGVLGIGQAAQRGIVIRNAAVLEKLARIRAVCFDKTGTLTRGELQARSWTVDGASLRQVLRRARALAAGSGHPVSRAILAPAHGRRGRAASVRNAQARPGAGVCAEIDGALCALGSRAFMTSMGWTLPASLDAACSASLSPRAYIGWAGRVRGLATFADTVRPEAAAVIESLHRLGLPSLLLSGDGNRAVAQLADSLGIRDWRGELLPEAKVDALRAWSTPDRAIAMVGDDWNDAPVLAEATVGIAVGHATDFARESADLILPRDGLSSLPWVIELARQVHRSIRANLFWSVAYNAVALTLAACGLLRPVLAAALMAGSSLLVVARSIRAQRRFSSVDDTQPWHSYAVAIDAPETIR